MQSKTTRTEASGNILAAVGTGPVPIVGLVLFSALVNVLYLTGSFYMLQVYDRVIPSRSVPTLVALSMLAAGLYAAQAALDFIRQRILSRTARSFDERLSPRVFGLIARLPLTARGGAVGLQPMRDLDQVRSFLAGGGPLAFFDLPWIPLYLAVCFLFHPVIGTVVLAGALLLFVLAICTEALTRSPVKAAAVHGAARGAPGLGKSDSARLSGGEPPLAGRAIAYEQRAR